MVFELAGDFAAALRLLPEDRPQQPEVLPERRILKLSDEHRTGGLPSPALIRPKRRILKLLEEALRHDIHFIHWHANDYPQGLFQCLWNTCWWYDCEEASAHYVKPHPQMQQRQRRVLRTVGGRNRKDAPLMQPEDEKLCRLLERWRDLKLRTCPGVAWVAVLRASGDEIRGVLYSPDGRRIAGGSDAGTVDVWDAETGRPFAVLSGHARVVNVNSVTFSPDGRHIASGSNDKTIRVWNIEGGAEIAVLRGHESPVRSVSFSPDGRLIVSGSDDYTVRVWLAQSGTEVAKLAGHKGSVNAAAYSLDGRRIVSGSDDRTIRVWDTRSGECLEVIEGSGDVKAIAAGASKFPLRAIARVHETVIEQIEDGKPVAWFPIALAHIVTHPSGRTWAGAVANHLYLISFEGTTKPITQANINAPAP